MADQSRIDRTRASRGDAEPVNVIAHSMGGLDARYMITHLGMAEQVRSLTTVATPHHGTFVADWFVANFRQRVPLLLALEAVGINVDGFKDCRLAECKTFNAATPDAPGAGATDAAPGGAPGADEQDDDQKALERALREQMGEPSKDAPKQ